MTNNIKKINTKVYSTYNQITKENDVIILSKEEYDKLPNNIKQEVKFVMAVKKDLTGGDDKPPKWFENWNQNEFQPLKQKVDNIEHRLDNIVKLNNLKE